MEKRMKHPILGPGRLTTEHSASSYNQPVFVDDATSTPHGPGDIAFSDLIENE